MTCFPRQLGSRSLSILSGLISIACREELTLESSRSRRRRARKNSLPQIGISILVRSGNRTKGRATTVASLTRLGIGFLCICGINYRNPVIKPIVQDIDCFGTPSGFSLSVNKDTAQLVLVYFDL